MKAGRWAEGIVEGGKVVCPWHAYAFDPCTGENDEDPEVRAIAIESKSKRGSFAGSSDIGALERIVPSKRVIHRLPSFLPSNLLPTARNDR